MLTCTDQKVAHIALLPSAGMGHLAPFCRLAALLANNNVKVTFITPNSTVSMAESEALSHFFTSFPHISQKQFHLLPIEKTLDNSDPFYFHMDSICKSSHLVSPVLASLSPPLSAVVTDMSLAASFVPITQALNLPSYVLFTSSAKMLALFLTYHNLTSMKTITDLNGNDNFKIPGLEEAIPGSWIPPPLIETTNNMFKTYFLLNSKKMAESSGILVNTFDSIEQEVIRKLNDKAAEMLPPVIALGPLAQCKFAKSKPLTWLHDQPDRSVVYVSFGSRTAMSREQIRELGEGLVNSGCRCLWTVKDKKVDREDEDSLNEVVGGGLMERLNKNGLVVKIWLNQEEILRHPAIGGFISHCGWNSVTEAIWHGVPILAWPQHGDQKINAGIIKRIGLGNWVENWGWGGEVLVNGKDIAEQIKEMMHNEVLRAQAMHVRDEARRAAAVGGSSSNQLLQLIETWKH